MIEIQGLQKIVDQNPVLDIDALVVEAGEIVAVVGPVGSGLSDLFDLLVGRVAPTLGTVRIADADPRLDREAFSRRVGVLFAEDSLYERQSPAGNLRFQCRLRGLPRSRAAEVLARIGLSDQTHARTGRLPSGLKRRLAFGCAIVHEPSDLVLVDPFSRCDAASIHLLGTLIRQLADAGAAVLILAEGDAHLGGVCDSIQVLDQGRIVESRGPTMEADRRPDLPFKIPVKMEARVALINPGDILYASADQGRTYLQTAAERLATQFTLSELEERLIRSGFFRAHRGYLVNLQHVREVIPYTRNSFSLILDDEAGTEIPLSKAAARELKDLLGY